MKSVEKQFGKQHLQNSVLETETTLLAEKSQQCAPFLPSAKKCDPKTQDVKPKTQDTRPETFKLGGPISYFWSRVLLFYV